MIIYRGLPVLEISPSAEENAIELKRDVGLLDPQTGQKSLFARDEAPKIIRQFRVILDGLAEINALEGFFNRCKGRAFPFWVPSFRQDLTLANSAMASDMSISVNQIGYVQWLWRHKARRNIALRNHSGIWAYRQVTSCSLSLVNESLVLNSQLGSNFNIGSMVSWLLYCRMYSDQWEITYHSQNVAEAIIQVIELPGETP